MAVQQGPGTQFASPQTISLGALLPIGGPLTYDECSWIDARVMQINGRDVTIAVGAAEPKVEPNGAGRVWSLELGTPTDRDGNDTGRSFVTGPATASGLAIVTDQGRSFVVAWSNDVELVAEVP
jgi:hypothetical protein